MIVFDLECGTGHRFEGWFGSSQDYASQLERGFLTCPACGSSEVQKAVMAPAVARKGNQLPVVAPRSATPSSAPAGIVPTAPQATALPPEAVAVFQALASMQAEALKSSRWVGGKFADNARAMHYGEKDAEAIHGQATPEEARQLVEEGIEIAPILFPVVPPNETN